MSISLLKKLWLRGCSSSHLRGPYPQALTLLGGARFITWRLSRLFLGECRRVSGYFWSHRRVWDTALCLDPPNKGLVPHSSSWCDVQQIPTSSRQSGAYALLSGSWAETHFGRLRWLVHGSGRVCLDSSGNRSNSDKYRLPPSSRTWQFRTENSICRTKTLILYICSVYSILVPPTFFYSVSSF